MTSTWIMTSGTLVRLPVSWGTRIRVDECCCCARTDEILGAVLPEELLDGAPSGFAATGHIGTCCILRLDRTIRSRFSVSALEPQQRLPAIQTHYRSSYLGCMRIYPHSYGQGSDVRGTEKRGGQDRGE